MSAFFTMRYSHEEAALVRSISRGLVRASGNFHHHERSLPPPWARIGGSLLSSRSTSDLLSTPGQLARHRSDALAYHMAVVGAQCGSRG